jgi:hypothetical protein
MKLIGLHMRSLELRPFSVTPAEAGIEQTAVAPARLRTAGQFAPAQSWRPAVTSGIEIPAFAGMTR